MKRILLVLMSLLLVSSLFGCNKKQDNDENVNETEEITFTSGLNITNNDVYDGQRKDFNFNNLVGEYGGFEIYNEGNQTFCLNFDGAVNVKGLIKNATDRPLGFTLQDVTIKGEFAKHEESREVISHPNGAANYVLQPGEEKIIQLDYSLFRWTSEDATESFIYNFKLGVNEESGDYSEYDVSFEETVKYLSNNTLLSNEYMNAIVKGRIIDTNGNPIANADVEVVNPFIELWNKIQTNENGEYSITVIGAKNSFSNAWRENALVVEKEGYNKRYIPVYPKSNQTITADVTLYEKENEYIYEEVKSIDVGLQAYEYDTNQNDIISFVPFHTGYNPKDVADKIRLTTTDFDGNIYYEYPLPTEIPFVEVSEDGQYTVVANNYDDRGGFDVVILDKSGKEVYKTHDLKPVDKEYAPQQANIDMGMSRCFQLSNDNKYLVASDADGDIWFIDWKNDKVLWSDYQFGQVRNIKFDKDSDVFYLSTGGGDLYCYDFDGNVKWKSDAQTWATKMEVTSKYVIVTLKCGGANLLVFDKTNGNLAWDYPTAQGNMALAISPDEKYLWYGAHSSSSYSKIGSSIFDLDTGKIIGMLNNQNCVGGQFSKDGSKIAVKRGGDVAVYDARNGALLWNTRICDGDSVQNCSVAINEDGSKFAVSMNDKYEGNYGIIHYFEFKEIRDYVNNPPANNQEPKNEPQDENHGVDKSLAKAVVYVEIGENVKLYVDDNNCLYDYEGPNGSTNFITNGLGRKDIGGKSVKDAIVDILYVADDLKIYTDDTVVKVTLDEIKSEAESSNKEMLKGVEDEIVNFRNMINVNFSYEIDDENYRVIQ